MEMRRSGLILFAVILVLAGLLAGCNKKPEETYPVQEGYLYGMCYQPSVRTNTVDYKKGFELMNNMGVKSIRLWMHVTDFLDGEFNVKQENVDLMKDILAEAEKYGLQVVGMSHRNVNKYYNEGGQYRAAKISPESDYYEEWLDSYYRGWKFLAETFPEVTIWEIDNETNNQAFMFNPETGGTFTLQEMAHISTDMFYYASKAIHEVNPEATTVMGGLVTWGGIDEFLTMLYQNIKSGLFGEGSTDPDDYFQALAWHPYMKIFNAEKWIKQNQEIYDLAYSYEGKHKTVYLTECGGFDWHMNEKQAAGYVEDMYEAVKELPFVEALHYWNICDHIAYKNCQSGMFVDPDPTRNDNLNGVPQTPGKPKLSAYAFQKVAGGEGSLELWMTDETIDTSVETTQGDSTEEQGEISLPSQILNSTDSFTVKTQSVYNLPQIDENFRIMQGGCVFGEYAWFLIVNAENYSDDDNKLCYVVKYNRLTMEEVGRSEPLLLGHANDATYVPETNELYIATHRNKVCVLDADTLEVKQTIESMPCYAIEYNQTKKNLVIATGALSQVIYDNELNHLKATNGQKTTLICQGICADHKYVYHVLYSSSSNMEEPQNMIFVVDWDGTLVTKIPIGMKGYEPENISLVGDTFYIGCNDGEGGVLFTVKLVKK